MTHHLNDDHIYQIFLHASEIRQGFDNSRCPAHEQVVPPNSAFLSIHALTFAKFPSFIGLFSICFLPCIYHMISAKINEP